MESTKRFSIRTLLNNMNAPKRKITCIYLIHISQLIKNHTASDEESYIDNYFKCTKINDRISKRHCLNCTMYKIKK